MKKIASVVMSVLMVLTLLVIPNNTVYANNVSISVSASSVDIGDSVTVTVTVPTGITAQIDVAYSSDLLSFSSCSTTANNNGSSVTMNLGSFSTPTATISFTAKASGTANFTVTPITAGSEETAEEVALGGASASVTIANQVTTQTPSTPSTPTTPSTPVLSDDNKLGYLKISSGKLSPSFSPNTTKYTATVNYDVTKVTVSAVPSSASAVVTAVSGGSDLQVGENTIKITVRAENGVSQTYTIVITRKEKVETPESETDNSETESETPVKKLSWNGSELDFVDNIPKDVIPAGFKTSTKIMNNEEVPVLDFKDGMLTVMYLSDENGDNSLYIYDANAQDVYPFVSLGSEEKYVVVLRPDDATVPAGYLSCTLSIEGKGVVSAYQFNTEELLGEEGMTSSWFGAETFFAAEPTPSDFYLLYCLNNEGEYGWYQYDSVEETFQRYSAALFHAAVTVEPEGQEGTDEEFSELDTLKKQMMIIIIVATVVVVILLIIIIVLAVKLSRKNDDYYDDEYDDEYDDDEDVYFYDDEEVDEIQEDVEANVDDEEIEIEFYEMQTESVTEPEVEEDGEEIEIEFYEMPTEATATPEVIVPDMEELLVKEALKEKEEAPKQVETPKQVEPPKKEETPKRVVTPIIVDDDDEDDSDLEFIDLD